MTYYLKGNLHTHTLYSDGRNTIEQMVIAYRNLGYGFVAITDHNLFLGNYSFPDIIVLNGCEQSRGDHYLEIRGRNETLLIKAHPNRYGDTCEEIDIGDWDCIEATEHSILHPYYIKCKKPCVYTDDSHNLNMVGHVWILVEVENKTSDDIIRSIKGKKYTLGGLI